MGRVVDQVFAVVIGYDLGILRQDLGVQLFDFVLYCLDNLGRVLAFSHDDDRFHDVVLVDDGAVARGIDGVGAADAAQAWDVGNRYVGHVFYQHGDIVVLGHNDIPDFPDIVEQTDAADDIGLIV